MMQKQLITLLTALLLPLVASADAVEIDGDTYFRGKFCLGE